MGLRFGSVFARPDAPSRGQPPRECDPDDQADNRPDCAGPQRFGLGRLIGHGGLVLQSRWRASRVSRDFLDPVCGGFHLTFLGLLLRLQGRVVASSPLLLDLRELARQATPARLQALRSLGLRPPVSAR